MEAKWKFWAVVVAALVAITALDVILRGEQFLKEHAPALGTYPSLRTLAAFLLALAIAWHCRAGLAARPQARNHPEFSPWLVLPACACVGGVLFAAICILVDPVLLGKFAREDGIVETASFLFLMLASGLLLKSALQARPASRRQHQAVSPAVQSYLFAIAAIVFVIAMEEISWGQRLVGFRTPDWVATGNIQSEFNLHNFATSKAENLYYIGAFGLLTFMYLVRDQLQPALRLAGAGLVFPGGATAIIGAMTTTLSYSMWNFLWFQVCFFSAVLALLLAALVRSAGQRVQRTLLFAAAGVLVLAQAIDLAFGPQMIRSWDDTEIKELVISIGLFAYGMDVSRNLRLPLGAT